MSLELGTPGWRLVGIIDGFAMLANAKPKQSRWVDLRAWPGKLLPLRDEVVTGVCRGATLAGEHVYTWTAPDKKRTALARVSGARAIGMLGASVAVVGDAVQRHDGAWQRLAGQGGPQTQAAIISLDAGALVVWGGRVLRFVDGALVETAAGDLPPAHAAPGFLPCGDGFVTAAGGKLVWVLRDGKQREDRALGKLQIVSVAPYENALLVRELGGYHLYDADTRTLERLDLGSTHAHPETVFWAPCGLLGIVGTKLVRFRV